MKLKYLLLTFIIIVVGVVTNINAETIELDTRIGYYSVGSLIPYRTSRVSYNIPMLFSGRVVHQVYNGMGLKGDVDNNYRLGAQVVYGLDIPQTGISMKPFVGFSLSSSDSISSSLSFDFGSEMLMNLFGLGVIVGAEAVTFSDSYMLDYYAGPNFSILPFLSADVLYTGLLSNNTHKVGFAGRVNLKF
jgi:hypothetical protein